MTLDEIVEWLNATYPTRDWDQRCAQLVWNVVHIVSSTPEARMATYDPAKAAYRASSIVSADAKAAPVGAIHYWANPTVEGHVAVGLGGETVLMTGTSAALNGGTLRGNNYGVTTVSAYSSRKGNPYLGWALAYGANTSIVGGIGGTNSTPTGWEEEDEEMNVGMFRKAGAVYHVIIGNLTSGFKFKYQTGSVKYNEAKLEQFKFAEFTQEDESVMRVFEESLDAVRQGK